MLNRGFYESRAVGRFGPITLLGLQKRCVQRNLANNITSFRFSDQQRIFQVLEGLEQAVDSTMARIADNRLHETLKIRAIMRGTDRIFQHWPFGATSVRCSPGLPAIHDSAVLLLPDAGPRCCQA